MKKIYLTLTLAMALFVSFQSSAQVLYENSLSLSGFDENELTVKAGDTVRIFVVAGSAQVNQRLSINGTIPSGSERVDSLLTPGAAGVYYVPKAAGEYRFLSDLPTNPEFVLTVLPDVPARYEELLNVTGFINNSRTVEVGDTVYFRVLSGGSRTITTVGTPPAPSEVVDVTLADDGPGFSYVPKAAGTYTFNTDLLISSDNFTLNVIQPPLVTAVDESIFFDGVSFFPNPVKSEMNVRLNSLYTYDIAIVNMSGNTLMSRTVANSNGTSFNIDNLAKGAYLLQLSNNASRKPKAFKFVKE